MELRSHHGRSSINSRPLVKGTMSAGLTHRKDLVFLCTSYVKQPADKVSSEIRPQSVHSKARLAEIKRRSEETQPGQKQCEVTKTPLSRRQSVTCGFKMPGIGQYQGMTAVFPCNRPNHKIYQSFLSFGFYFEVLVLFLHCVCYSTAHTYEAQLPTTLRL